MKKGGQVTIFIIVGIVIVVGIFVMIFLMGGMGGKVLSPSEMGPRNFITSCVGDIVEDSVDEMMRNGGEIVASQTILYNDTEWNYLCYQSEPYLKCYNIHPMLELQIEEGIELDTGVGVQDCFDIMVEDFEDKGFDVSMGEMMGSIDLLPGYVAVNLRRTVEISSEGGAQSFEDFGFDVVSPIYDLVRVSREIVNDESRFCDFGYNAYMFLYPDYDIRRTDYRDSKIYRVIDRQSGSEFKFAVRSCAFERDS